MKQSSNITFILFTQNEEKRIEYPIKCFLPYGEVIVSDDNSTDNTVNIARKLGARVIKRKSHTAYVENKEETDFIFKQIKTDWVFWGFADNMVPKTCLDLYVKIAKENKYKIVVQKLKTLLYENREYFTHVNVATKFFRKDAVDFSNNVIHQIGKYAKHVKPNDILYLPPINEYSIYHFSTQTTTSIMAAANNYSTAHAKTTPTKFLGIKTILFSFLYFLHIYILNGAFRYGFEGFFVAVQYSFYHVLIYAKAYENKYKLSPNSIEKDYFSKIKKQMLQRSPRSNIFKKIVANMENAFVSRLHGFYKFK